MFLKVCGDKLHTTKVLPLLAKDIVFKQIVVNHSLFAREVPGLSPAKRTMVYFRGRHASLVTNSSIGRKSSCLAACPALLNFLT